MKAEAIQFNDKKVPPSMGRRSYVPSLVFQKGGEFFTFKGESRPVYPARGWDRNPYSVTVEAENRREARRVFQSLWRAAFRYEGTEVRQCGCCTRNLYRFVGRAAALFLWTSSHKSRRWEAWNKISRSWWPGPWRTV